MLRRNFAHHPLDGGHPTNSHGGSSPKGDPCGGPPFNPLVELFGWLALDPHMFLSPWHPPIVAQLTLKQTIKLLYKNLKYSTYVKDVDPNAYVRIFKEAIKNNGETVEVDIINLFDFTLKNNTKNGVKILFKIIQIANLKNWNKPFANDLNYKE